MNNRVIIPGLLLFCGGLFVGIFSWSQLHENDKTEIKSIVDVEEQVDSKDLGANNLPTEIPAENQDQMTRLAARLDEEIARREELETQLARLELRVELIDSNNNAAVEAPVDAQTAQIQPASGQAGLNPEILVASGVNADTADELVAYWNRYQLEQLELRDTAAREGWLDSDEYREKARALSDDRKSLRDEIGDDKYDRYLYESGETNRVTVDSVIAGSSAESIGLRPGDIITGYAGERTFTGRELQNATRDGTRGETVGIEIFRDGSRLELTVPRGPLGIMLDARRIEPDE